MRVRFRVKAPVTRETFGDFRDETFERKSIELSELTKNYHNAYVKLYKALGGGWISKEEMDEAQNHEKEQKKKLSDEKDR